MAFCLTIDRRSQTTVSQNKSPTRLLTLTFIIILVCSPGHSLTVAANLTPEVCLEDRTKWQSLAERGDAHAQFKLGVCYETGNMVQRDAAEAIQWYRRAAAQRHELAMWHLFYLYRHHDGIPSRGEAASTWLRQAAQEGDAVAQYLLAEGNMNGTYGPPNLVEAYIWFTLSERQGFPPARQQTELLERQLRPSELRKAQQHVNQWKPQK